MAEASATAEGELGRTPLAHLLVYALDRRLTGAIFLAPPEGAEHVIRLVRGVPVKVKPGDGFALLGEMLIEAGAIDAATLEAALATKGLLGDMLLLAGRVERDTLEKVAEEQFKKRMVRLFALPPATVYRYYDGHEALADYGGDPATVDPLALLWAGLRAHGEASAMMDTTLARLGEVSLRISQAATVSRFGLDAEDARLFERLTPEAPVTVGEAPQLVTVGETQPVSGEAPASNPSTPRPPSLSELCAATAHAPTRRLVYALTITRQIETGTGVLPCGAEVAPASSRRDLPSSSTAAVSSGSALGRMALKSTVHRVGAAAPDAPGDGERGPSIARRLRDRGAGSGDEPSSSRTSIEPPVSSVDSVPGAVSGPKPVGPDSGVVQTLEAAEAPPAEAPPVDRRSLVESDTLRSAALDSIENLRASAPDLASEVAAAEAIVAGERAAREAATVEGAPPALEVAEEAGEEDAFAGMSPEELFWLGNECLAERDMKGALEACCAGLRAAPEDMDLRALEAWARAQSGGADIKALAVQLDEVLQADEEHVEARYYRGMLRKRLGDEEGSLRDLRQVMTLSPDHEGASLALAAAEQRQLRKSERPGRISERPSLFGKLFKR